jgi:hypothetical protein
MRSNKHLIFKPSGITWRLGKCDRTNISFSSQLGSLGGSENAIKQTSHFQAKWDHLANRVQGRARVLAGVFYDVRPPLTKNKRNQRL